MAPPFLVAAWPALVVHAVMLFGGGVHRRLAAQPPAPPSLASPACEDARDASDSDGDGLTDACELALAQAWAPRLLADPADCSWTGESAARRLAGGYFFAVTPLSMDGRGARIAYLPAYLHDCGWRGMQRLLRFGRTNAHAGDSELIVIDAARGADAVWRVSGVFLSAHCGGRSGGRCRWFRGSALADFRWAGRPGDLGADIWVARDKHANYPSRNACESGHWLQERCASKPIAYRFPIRSHAQNIGSRHAPALAGAGCVDGAALPVPAAGALCVNTECFWDPRRPFAGWQGAGKSSADAYSVILERFARM